jgi:hypothetical protein
MFYTYDFKLKKYTKKVSLNIKDFMIPVVFAHLIMGDGNFKSDTNIIRIYTNSFTKQDVDLLSEAIKRKLGIKTELLHDRNNQYIIIRKDQLAVTRSIIQKYMHTSLLYRIGINKSLNEIAFSYIENFDEI